MSVTKIFPTILIVLYILAAVFCLAVDGNWRRFIYWISAAALTASITY